MKTRVSWEYVRKMEKIRRVIRVSIIIKFSNKNLLLTANGMILLKGVTVEKCTANGFHMNPHGGMRSCFTLRSFMTDTF